jgi:hypothetical protein
MKRKGSRRRELPSRTAIPHINEARAQGRPELAGGAFRMPDFVAWAGISSKRRPDPTFS